MESLKLYYKNTSLFVCPECDREFKLNFIRWFFTTRFDMIRYRCLKCPYCGARHWMKAKEVM